MIFLIRANHANEFELQNYAPLAKDLGIKVITSRHPLTQISLPSIPLWSPTDLPDFPYRRQLLNRIVGGEQWLFGLEKFIKKHSVVSIQRNIVHTAETYTPYTHQAVQMRKQGLISKLVCTCWETIPHNNEKFGRLRKWKQEAYRYVDLFHTPTNRARQALIEEGVDKGKILVIPYGVDLSRFKQKDLQGQTLQGKRKTVLTVARLEKEKGMEDLELVAKALPHYDFLVAGRGNYLLLGANIQTTTIPYDQIHTLYQQADLFFLPSRSTSTWEEQYGMVLVEAMASGLPILTTYCGSIPEVVGQAGIILAEGDIDEMIKVISETLSNKSQASKLNKIGIARVKKLYDAHKISKLLTHLYA